MMRNGQLPLLADVTPSANGLPLAEELSDGRLLERFVRTGDGAAFAAVVRRHGPMVLGVCRRVLGNDQDAEDAFQATFLVLARKAGSLSRPELLGNWLHGVAYRTARHARARTARRLRREREAAMSEARNDPQQALAQELRQLLDQELAHLPEKYRAPLVLCYLQGKTHHEAARLLGWPPGSMSYRLARGREMLHRRLSRRKLALFAVPGPLFITDPPEVALPPPLLAEDTVRTGLALRMPGATTAALVSASVQELMDATLRSLDGSGRRRLAGVLLSLLLVSALALAAQRSLQQAPAHTHRPAASCCKR
jgi:RNA polymerase sigma factor (sigma-70 family)